MPKVTHVKAAKKDNPVAKTGEPYYWWKFRFGGKHYSRTRPRQSQLTQSAYLGSVYSIIEQIEDAELNSVEDFEALVESVRGDMEALRDETQSSLDNMPDSLQESPTGQLLQERIDALENIDSEMDCFDEFEFEEEELDEDDYAVEDYDSVEERDEAFKADKEEHESQEESRREEELGSWLEDAKTSLGEMFDQAVI